MNRSKWYGRHLGKGGRLAFVILGLLVIPVAAWAGWTGTTLDITADAVAGGDAYSIVIDSATVNAVNDANPVQSFLGSINSFAGNAVSVSFVNASPGDSANLALGLAAPIGNAGIMYLGDLTGISPWPGVTVEGYQAFVCGWSISPGSSGNSAALTFSFDALDPDEVLAAATISLPFDEAVPSCP